jgi:chromosome segregation protein
LAPRLAGLERAVAAGREQQQLEQRVAGLRGAVIAAGVSRHQLALTKAGSQLGALGDRLKELQAQRSTLEREQQAHTQAANRAAAAKDRLRAALTQLEQQRDGLSLQQGEQAAIVSAAELAAGRAADLRAQVAAAKNDLAAAETRHTELAGELASNATASARALKAVERAGAEVAAAGDELVAVRKSSTGDDRDQYARHALQVLKLLAADLRESDPPLERVRLLVHKAGRLLGVATNRADAQELLATLAAAQKKLEAAMAKREVAVEHQTNIVITARSLEIDLAHQADAVSRCQDTLGRLQTELAPAEHAARELKKHHAKAASISAALAAATAKIDAERHQIRELENSGEAARPAGIAAEIERLHITLRDLQNQVTATREQESEARARLRTVEKRSATWKIELPAPGHTVGASLEDLEAELIKTEASLEAHAAATRDQAAEFEAVESRHGELAGQITDLERAQADLEQVVAQLDAVIRERFKANFQSLADQFSAYFTRLFGGGSASLTLQTGPDGSYGVEIKASPKGKRLSNLQTLSGGERALAGVALLAAILRVNPSPFVVLDEIDAALDEANSGRLSQILQELQAQSQLIVITHNRQTMNAARVLFGITTGEHHSSRLLSIKLEDATALAAR